MSYLVLHGVANHRPPAHWEFQLAAALAAGGAEVRYPSLPSPDDPHPAEWQAAIERELRELNELGSPPVVIAHSLGVEAWLALGPAVASQASRVLLVAPPDAAAMAENAPRFALATPFATPAGWELWCSDGDPYNVPGGAASHGDPFGLEVRVFPGAGHFTPDDGYGVWPEVLTWARAAATD